MPLPPVTRYRLTSHALQEMERRNITEAEVAQVLANPEQSEMIVTGAQFIKRVLNRATR